MISGNYKCLCMSVVYFIILHYHHYYHIQTLQVIIISLLGFGGKPTGYGHEIPSGWTLLEGSVAQY